MNCERIQELILTDYLDGTLKSDVFKIVEDHLAGCPQCSQFLRTAKETAFESFKGSQRAAVPGHLWSRIERAIHEEAQLSVERGPSLLERLRAVFAVPRPVFVLASVLVLFLAAGTVRQVAVSHRIADESSAEYLTSLVEVSTDFTSNDNNGFGTQVEQVFL